MELTPLEVLGIFVGIPLALFALIALLVVAPSWARDARYRPGLPWTAEPVWFEGPERDGDGPAERRPNGGGGASADW